jgi:uncharacterized integral membrane protein
MELIYTIIVAIIVLWLIIGIFRVIFYRNSRLSFFEEMFMWDLIGELITIILTSHSDDSEYKIKL